jgi:hypothetical protein
MKNLQAHSTSLIYNNLHRYRYLIANTLALNILNQNNTLGRNPLLRGPTIVTQIRISYLQHIASLKYLQ